MREIKYIGSKDENGVEILEGDIVWIWQSSEEQGECLTYPIKVEWNNLDKKYNIPEGTFKIEKIGNIYDNPELIEECE